MTVSNCRACGSDAIVALVDAGRQPVANRFLPTADAPEEQFPLELGQCDSCGLAQLVTPMPAGALVPRFDWLAYNEPEGHLDPVTESILALPGVTPTSTVGAITYKDDSTLARLRQRGINATWRIDAAVDLIAGPTAGLETIQDRLSGEMTGLLAAKYGPADVLLVRHILEHAYDTQRFLAALRHLVRPGGYMVFEVPDCTQVFDTLDYTTLWEEHVLYFTPATLQDTLVRAGFELVHFASHPYPYENSLVAMVRPGVAAAPTGATVVAERARGQRFAAGLGSRRREIQASLARYRAQGGRAAVFGAGHLSCMFINLMQVAGYIDFVVDDHPAKRGMFMPGSHLPIRQSDALISERIDLCLSTLSPESEEKVVAKHTTFLDSGGRFASVFPSSRRAFVFSD